MVRLFQPLIKSPSVHRGGVSDPVSCVVGFPSCVWRDLCCCCCCCRLYSTPRPPLLLLLLLFLHPPTLRQRRAATEALARFQRGSDPAATSITSSPLGNYGACGQTAPAFGFCILLLKCIFRDIFRLCSLVFGYCLLLLFLLAVLMCVFFM